MPMKNGLSRPLTTAAIRISFNFFGAAFTAGDVAAANARATAEVAAIVKRTLPFLNLFPLFERGLTSRLIQEVRGHITLTQGFFQARIKSNNQITTLAHPSNPQLLVEGLVWRLDTK